jgi:hypothetical protein
MMNVPQIIAGFKKKLDATLHHPILGAKDFIKYI